MWGDFDYDTLLFLGRLTRAANSGSLHFSKSPIP